MTDTTTTTSPTPEQLKECGLKHLYRGKVRDMYAAGDDKLLMVASDRMSAYDVIMGEDIPNKGAVLNGVSAYWFDTTQGIIANHCLSTDVTDFPASGADGFCKVAQCWCASQYLYVSNVLCVDIFLVMDSKSTNKLVQCTASRIRRA